MSNKRRLRGAAASRSAERCSFCSRRIGANMDVLRLRTGQVACPACRQGGELARCPACGRACLPGSLVIRNEGGNNDVRCPACAPGAAALAGNMRLGMAPREARS